MNTSDQQLRDAQARYKRHFGTRLCRTTHNLSPDELVFAEATLNEQPRKLAPVASDSFPAVA